MPGLLKDVDPEGLLEYSVVYSDRSLNHMSKSFQAVMNSISTSLKEVYSAAATIVVPGSGTYAMEAVARQFAAEKDCLVIRNGFFSFRWSQIFEMAKLPSSEKVLMARQIRDEKEAPFAPPPLEEVIRVIQTEQPDLVFAPHVETSAGMMLDEAYLKGIADAVHAHGGLFVLDCIASGTIWVDMGKLGIDVLISAPQKGWSGSPCSGLVMLSDHALDRLESTQSNSFACDLKKWHQIMNAYEKGAHAYHCTMPTDALVRFHDVIEEIRGIGWNEASRLQQELGHSVRQMLEKHGIRSVAAEGFQSPGVVVSHTSDPDIQNGKKFMAAGIQVAGGVPLKCNEREDFQSFRIGLFGIDKLLNRERTVNELEQVVKTLS